MQSEKKRRSSILKPPKARNPLSDLDMRDQNCPEDEGTMTFDKNKRVSFSTTKGVALFTMNDQGGTIWHDFYELPNKMDASESGNAVDLFVEKMKAVEQDSDVESMDNDLNTTKPVLDPDEEELEGECDMSITETLQAPVQIVSQKKPKIKSNTFVYSGVKNKNSVEDKENVLLPDCLNFSMNIENDPINNCKENNEGSFTCALSEMINEIEEKRPHENRPSAVNNTGTKTILNDISMMLHDLEDKKEKPSTVNRNSKAPLMAESGMDNLFKNARNPYSMLKSSEDLKSTESKNKSANGKASQNSFNHQKTLIFDCEKSNAEMSMTCMTNLNINNTAHNQKRRTVVFHEEDTEADMSMTCPIKSIREDRFVSINIPMDSKNTLIKNDIDDDKSMMCIFPALSMDKNLISKNNRNTVIFDNNDANSDMTMTCTVSNLIKKENITLNQRNLVNFDDRENLFSRRNTIVFENNDIDGEMTMTDVIPGLLTKKVDENNLISEKEGNRRKTIIFDQNEANADMTMTNVIPALLSEKFNEINSVSAQRSDTVSSNRRKTIVFDQNDVNSDMTMTNVIPGLITEKVEIEGSDAVHPDRRKTIVFDQNDVNSDMTMTHVIPSLITEKVDINGSDAIHLNRRKTIVFDHNDVNSDMTITNVIPGIITEKLDKNRSASAHKPDTINPNRRKTIVFDQNDVNSDMTMTNVIPGLITEKVEIEGSDAVHPDRRKTIIFHHNDVNSDMTITNVTPGIITEKLDKNGSASAHKPDTINPNRRKTIVFDQNDVNSDMTMTNVIPGLITEKVDIEGSDAVHPDRRKTIIFDHNDVNSDMTITNVIPGMTNVVPSLITEKIETNGSVSAHRSDPVHPNRRKTIVFDQNDVNSDMTMTNVISGVPSEKILIKNETVQASNRRKTIVFDQNDVNSDVTMTNIIFSEFKENVVHNNFTYNDEIDQRENRRETIIFGQNDKETTDANKGRTIVFDSVEKQNVDIDEKLQNEKVPIFNHSDSPNISQIFDEIIRSNANNEIGSERKLHNVPSPVFKIVADSNVKLKNENPINILIDDDSDENQKRMFESPNVSRFINDMILSNPKMNTDIGCNTNARKSVNYMKNKSNDSSKNNNDVDNVVIQIPEVTERKSLSKNDNKNFVFNENDSMNVSKFLNDMIYAKIDKNTPTSKQFGNTKNGVDIFPAKSRKSIVKHGDVAIDCKDTVILSSATKFNDDDDVKMMIEDEENIDMSGSLSNVISSTKFLRSDEDISNLFEDNQINKDVVKENVDVSIKSTSLHEMKESMSKNMLAIDNDDKLELNKSTKDVSYKNNMSSEMKKIDTNHSNIECEKEKTLMNNSNPMEAEKQKKVDLNPWTVSTLLVRDKNDKTITDSHKNILNESNNQIRCESVQVEKSKLFENEDKCTLKIPPVMDQIENADNDMNMSVDISFSEVCQLNPDNQQGINIDPETCKNKSKSILINDVQVENNEEDDMNMSVDMSIHEVCENQDQLLAIPENKNESKTSFSFRESDNDKDVQNKSTEEARHTSKINLMPGASDLISHQNPSHVLETLKNENVSVHESKRNISADVPILPISEEKKLEVSQMQQNKSFAICTNRIPEIHPNMIDIEDDNSKNVTWRKENSYRNCNENKRKFVKNKEDWTSRLESSFISSPLPKKVRQDDDENLTPDQDQKDENAESSFNDERMNFKRSCPESNSVLPSSNEDFHHSVRMTEKDSNKDDHANHDDCMSSKRFCPDSNTILGSSEEDHHHSIRMSDKNDHDNDDECLDSEKSYRDTVLPPSYEDYHHSMGMSDKNDHDCVNSESSCPDSNSVNKDELSHQELDNITDVSLVNTTLASSVADKNEESFGSNENNSDIILSLDKVLESISTELNKSDCEIHETGENLWIFLLFRRKIMIRIDFEQSCKLEVNPRIRDVTLISLSDKCDKVSLACTAILNDANLMSLKSEFPYCKDVPDILKYCIDATLKAEKWIRSLKILYLKYGFLYDHPKKIFTFEIPSAMLRCMWRVNIGIKNLPFAHLDDINIDIVAGDSSVSESDLKTVIESIDRDWNYMTNLADGLYSFIRQLGRSLESP